MYAHILLKFTQFCGGLAQSCIAVVIISFSFAACPFGDTPQVIMCDKFIRKDRIGLARIGREYLILDISAAHLAGWKSFKRILKCVALCGQEPQFVLVDSESKTNIRRFDMF